MLDYIDIILYYSSFCQAGQVSFLAGLGGSVSLIPVSDLGCVHWIRGSLGFELVGFGQVKVSGFSLVSGQVRSSDWFRFF